MRALESEIWWTFPAIKKQVDSLEESDVITIDKEGTGRAIQIKEDFFELFKEFFFQSLKHDLKDLFTAQGQIKHHFWWDKFGTALGIDLIVIHQEMEKEQIDPLKAKITDTFRDYRIESASMVFMSAEEREKRYRLADRFVLQVMRHYNSINN